MPHMSSENNPADFPVGLRLRLRRPDRSNDIALEAADGEVLAELMEQFFNQPDLTVELLAVRGLVQLDEVGFTSSDDYVEHCQCDEADWCTHNLGRRIEF